MVFNYLYYFVIFSFLGWLSVGVRNIILEKKFTNSGFLNLPFCPTYGLCAVVCFFVMHRFSGNMAVLFIGSSFSLSLIVSLIGVITHKFLGFRPWDYTPAKTNIGPYVTLFSALLFGVLGVVLVYVAEPLIDVGLSFFPELVKLITAGVLCLLMIADAIFSLITIHRLKSRIRNLSNTSSLADGTIPDEKLEEIKSNYNKIYTESLIRKRLASSFPDLKTSYYIKAFSNKVQETKQENMLEYSTVYSSKDKEPFAFGICFAKLFLLFVIGSMCGTILETIWAFLIDGNFQIRVGMVYGPFIPVYGGGAVFLTVALYKLYKLSDTLVFIISAVVGASFEYFCSWFQETMFGTVSWDYTGTLLNIDGRTNLMYGMIWGFLGLVWLRYLYPWVSKLVERIPKKIGGAVTVALIIFMLFNSAVSMAAVARWQQRLDGVAPQNKYDDYLDENFDNERMEFLFPNMKEVEKTGVTLEGVVGTADEIPTSDTVNSKNNE